MIAYDLDSGEGTDRGAKNDVAGPVAIVVHPRHADGGGAYVEGRTDQRVRCHRPPDARLCADGRRGGECRNRVT